MARELSTEHVSSFINHNFYDLNPVMLAGMGGGQPLLAGAVEFVKHRHPNTIDLNNLSNEQKITLLDRMCLTGFIIPKDQLGGSRRFTKKKKKKNISKGFQKT
jgi:hypothetical protein